MCHVYFLFVDPFFCLATDCRLAGDHMVEETPNREEIGNTVRKLIMRIAPSTDL